MSNAKIKFTKVDRGWYATADGTMAVVADGYTPGNLMIRDGSGYDSDAGVVGEWALVRDSRGRLREDHNAGENLDWFPTKKAAVAAASAASTWT